MFRSYVVGKHIGNWIDVRTDNIESYQSKVISNILQYIFLVNYPAGLAVAKELGIEELGDILNYEFEEEVGGWKYDVWRPPWLVAAASRRFKIALLEGHPGAMDALRNATNASEWSEGPAWAREVAAEFERFALVCDFMTELGETQITLLLL